MKTFLKFNEFINEVKWYEKADKNNPYYTGDFIEKLLRKKEIYQKNKYELNKEVYDNSFEFFQTNSGFTIQGACEKIANDIKNDLKKGIHKPGGYEIAVSIGKNETMRIVYIENPNFAGSSGKAQGVGFYLFTSSLKGLGQDSLRIR